MTPKKENYGMPIWIKMMLIPLDHTKTLDICKF